MHVAISAPLDCAKVPDVAPVMENIQCAQHVALLVDARPAKLGTTEISTSNVLKFQTNVNPLNLKLNRLLHHLTENVKHEKYVLKDTNTSTTQAHQLLTVFVSKSNVLVLTVPRHRVSRASTTIHPHATHAMLVSTFIKRVVTVNSIFVSALMVVWQRLERNAHTTKQQAVQNVQVDIT